MKAAELLSELGLFKTKSEAAQLIFAGAVKINGVRVTKEDDFEPAIVQKIEIGKTKTLELS